MTSLFATLFLLKILAKKRGGSFIRPYELTKTLRTACQLDSERSHFLDSFHNLMRLHDCQVL